MITLATLALMACSPGRSAPAEQRAERLSGMSMEWHADKRRVDAAVDAALEGAGGADYPTAIAVLRGSGRPAGVVDLEVGQLVTSAYRDDHVARMPWETLVDGIVLMERAALTGGEAAGIAPQRLRLLFERGLERNGQVVLAPNPAIAACWRGIEEGRARGGAVACVEMRPPNG